VAEFVLFLEGTEGESEELVQNCVTDFRTLMCKVEVKEKKSERDKERPGLRSRLASSKDQWHLPLAKHFGDGYETLATEALWGIRTAVFVKKEVLPRVSLVDKDRVATGVGGVAGNKGAVGISFKVADTSFCFVNSHLAAHQEKVKERNVDYHKILKGLHLGLKDIDIVHQFDHVFWFGDLNYRSVLFSLLFFHFFFLPVLDLTFLFFRLDFPRDKVLNLISRKNFDGLFEFDQLRAEMRSNTVFQGFVDEEPTFAPTYKYEVTPQVVDPGAPKKERVYSDKKQRVPSYCDRVLVRSQPNSPVRRTSLRSCDDITTSDHSPLSSTFLVQLRSPFSPGTLLSAVDTNRCQIRFLQLKGPANLASKRSDPGSVYIGPFVCFHAPFLPMLYSSTIFPRKVCTPSVFIPPGGT